MSNRRSLIGLWIAVVLAAGSAGALSGCTTNAATGKSQFNSLSREDEIALGDEAKAELAGQYGGPIQSAELQAYVSEVGRRMTPHVEGDYATLPWEFTLLNSDVINAFALPGGKVFITRGLASKLEDESELAGVLGHEIGHVTAEHADKRISNAMIFQGIAIGAAVAAGQSGEGWVEAAVPLVVGVGGQGFLMKFGRDEELEADALGMRYMSRAGYDPAGQLGVMQVLAKESGGARQPEILSTHPLPETRIDRIKKTLQEKYASTQGNPEYRSSADEYRRRMLDPLSRIAPPPKAKADATNGAVEAAPAAYARFFGGGVGHDRANCPICTGQGLP